MEYKITDNFLSDEEFNAIQEVMLGDSFAWFLNPYVTVADQKEDQFQFTHNFYNYDRPQSNYLDLLQPILTKISPKAFIRIKANLTGRTDKIYETGWHTDFDFECTTAVFYLNDNNGYTKFEDGTIVESVANRFVEFNSLEKHTGTTHTDSKIRSVINFNYFK